MKSEVLPFRVCGRAIVFLEDVKSEGDFKFYLGSMMIGSIVPSPFVTNYALTRQFGPLLMHGSFLKHCL